MYNYDQKRKLSNKMQAQVISKKGKRNLVPGLSLKSLTFRGSEWEYKVQIEAPNTPECQEGVTSQGGQQREEHRVIQQVQVEHYEGLFK